MMFQAEHLKPLIGSAVSADRGALLAGAYSAQLRELLEQRGVLLFRRINFDDAQQFAFAKTLGEVLPQGEKGIYKITLDKTLNATADYLHATYHWHIDGAQDKVPQLASLLSARVLSQVGGQTEFANTYAAYEHLPEDRKRLADSLRVVHSQEYIQRKMHPNPTEEQLARWRQHSEQVHPMVWTHRSGRKSLVLGLTAGRIEGKSEAESHAILEEFQTWATHPQFGYRHHWTVGDMIIWDNTGVMHRVEKYPEDSGRLLSRTTLVGEESIA